MQRKQRLGAFLLMLTLLVTGCWDRSELEDQFYVLALGVDRGEQHGEYVVTALVGLVQLFSSGTLEAPVKPQRPFLGVAKLTMRATSVTQAIHILSTGTTRRLDLRHVRLIVIGEELAREGVEPLVVELTRNLHTRGSNLLLQARGSAHELLAHMEPVGEMNASRMAEGYLLLGKQLHLAPPIRFHHFFQRLTSRGGDPYLPVAAVNEGISVGSQLPGPMPEPSALPGQIPRGGGNPVEVVGTAIFHKDRLKGFLTLDETQMLLALRGEMGKSYMSIQDPLSPKHMVALRFHQENVPGYRAELRSGEPWVSGRIVFEGEVLSIPSGVDYADPALRPRLEEAAARHAESAIRALLSKLHTWEADPVGFGNRYRIRFASYEDWAAWGWSDRIRNLKVDVRAEMRVRRYGLVSGREVMQK